MNKILSALIATILITTMPAFAQDKPVLRGPVTNNSVENNIGNAISTSNYSISVIDPNPDTNPSAKYYPGYRGANQLIVYTPKFGLRTGTNEFGQEVVVIDGFVQKYTGSDSIIPSNGFVVSGHGGAKKWISENLKLGTKVQISPDCKTIKSIIVPESYTYQAKQKINEVSSIILDQKQLYSGYDSSKSEKFIQESKELLTKADKMIADQEYTNAQTIAANASELADEALYHAIPHLDNELKGVWIRPTEKTPESIAATLDKINAAGIDNVFLETYYQGYTIFPSSTLKSYGVKEQRSEFKGWDPLQCWISEAHKRNMKVHIWFQTFYVGIENPAMTPKHVLAVHPDWANVQKRNAAADKPMSSPAEHNGYFLDPANPEVQQYLTSLITEIVNNYDIDGLNIDYIRYPVSLSTNFPNFLDSTWGYSRYARSEFCQRYGIDPVNLTNTSANWDKWNQYRQDKVTQLVSKLQEIKGAKNITISTVIFPDFEESSLKKMQDWRKWSNMGYIDAFTPLVMGNDENLAADYVKEIQSAGCNNVKVYTGLFQTFTYGTPSDMLKQIAAARKAGVNGLIIFDYAHLSDEFSSALTKRTFKK